MFTSRLIQPEPDQSTALHRLYTKSERYFEVIASSVPAEVDVQHELETAFLDARRHLEFIYQDNSAEPIGYLDLTFDYPKPDDVTINLMLVGQPWQSVGVGGWIAQNLESRLLDGSIRKRYFKRVLAGIYGDNPGAIRFWERLGYTFAIDARPVLSWYAKEFVTQTEPVLPEVQTVTV